MRSQEALMHIVGSSAESMQIVGLALHVLDNLPERACRLIFDHAGGVGDFRSACALVHYCCHQTVAASRTDRNQAGLQKRIASWFLPDFLGDEIFV